jgi:hypothetical protein
MPCVWTPSARRACSLILNRGPPPGNDTQGGGELLPGARSRRLIPCGKLHAERPEAPAACAVRPIRSQPVRLAPSDPGGSAPANPNDKTERRRRRLLGGCRTPGEPFSLHRAWPDSRAGIPRGKSPPVCPTAPLGRSVVRRLPRDNRLAPCDAPCKEWRRRDMAAWTKPPRRLPCRLDLAFSGGPLQSSRKGGHAILELASGDAE